MTIDEKLEYLLGLLKDMGSAVLAYSGGVDSTLLLKALKLSGIKTLAVTSSSETVPQEDLNNAISMTKEIGIPLRIIKTRELENEDFLKNSMRRCFHCKDELFKGLKAIALKEGLAFVIDGSNVDDKGDYRPGIEAAVKWGVRSPLIEAGFTKEDIREASKSLGLFTWNKPSSPCLASRFPYGMRITPEGLKKVASAEKSLKDMGFGELRVRHHGDMARIELKENDITRLIDPGIRHVISSELKSIGYRFISVDIEGMRSGRMNEGILDK